MSKRVLVVGAGLTGATIARTLADAGMEVEVVEKRDRIGGNCADYLHESGCYVCHSGPHYFRTDSERIWQWANRFASFYPYEARIMSWVEGRYEHWPMNWEYINRLRGTWDLFIPPHNNEYLNDWKPRNFEEACLEKMPEEAYLACVKFYTEKQWGVPAVSLDATLAARVEVRTDGDTRLKRSKWQGIPRGGYSVWITKMLEGIDVKLGVECLSGCGLRYRFHDHPIVYTGPIDALFDHDMGKLKYRGQRRQTVYYAPARCGILPCGQVNIPKSSNKAVRLVEWRHFAEHPGDVKGTVLTEEVPYTPDDPDGYEYPFPSKSERELYLQYKKRADAIPGLVVAGRLGTFKYLDMDQSISHGLKVAEQVLTMCGCENARNL